MTQLEVEYFTDPICSWSWGMELQLLELRTALQGRATFRLRLVAMIDGPNFSDPVQGVHNPGQWAPLWWEMSRATGMPCDPGIWHSDPPTDSRLPCLAVSAARIQGERCAWALLRRLREAVMLERRNVARMEVLEEIVSTLGEEGRIDVDAWREDLRGTVVRDTLREDISQASYHGIRRFPSLLLRPAGSSRAMLLVGWRPWRVLADALRELGLPAEPEMETLLALTDGLTEEERLMLEISGKHFDGWTHTAAGPTSVWRPPLKP